MSRTADVPAATAIKNVITGMKFREINNMVANAKGYRLRALLDAALDVAEQSEYPDFRRTAGAVITAARVSHPEYFDPTLRGA